MSLKKILAVLVNYGDEQLVFLEEVVRALKSFQKYSVHIVVNSNIPLDIEGIDMVNVLSLPDFQLLPLTCRKVIWDSKNDYDLFVFGENDHLFLEHHIDNHLKYSEILPENRIPGLIQYEENETGRYYPAYHLDFEWDYTSVEVHKSKVFAHFSNLHQASFILTQEQLHRVGTYFDFTALVDETPTLITRAQNKVKKKLGLKVERPNLYSVKCKVNTDVYAFAGMKKLICISDFESNLIHHLPNIYIDGLKGRNKLRSDADKMDAAVSKLLQIATSK